MMNDEANHEIWYVRWRTEGGKTRNEILLAQNLKDVIRIASENDLIQFRNVSGIVNDHCDTFELPKKCIEYALRVKIGAGCNEFHIDLLTVSIEKAPKLIGTLLATLKNGLDSSLDEYGIFYPI
ncbi:MAG: hypothetical protein H0U45_11620 [Tatlockia sp.]|jgi:hypothetical protein|nr:hypothetical protein [Tatlockia sp.]